MSNEGRIFSSETRLCRLDRLVDDLCREIDYLEEELEKERKEKERWRDRYNEMIDDSLRHSRKMTGEIIVAALDQTTRAAEEVAQRDVEQAAKDAAGD